MKKEISKRFKITVIVNEDWSLKNRMLICIMSDDRCLFITRDCHMHLAQIESLVNAKYSISFATNVFQILDLFICIVKLLTERHMEFLSLKDGCRGSSESTLVKMTNCWKSHEATQL